MRPVRALGLVLAVVAVSVLSGCIAVDDLDGYWDKGVIDPQLEGYWRHVETKKTPRAMAAPFPGGQILPQGVPGRPPSSLGGNTYLSFRRDGDHYLTRTVNVGGEGDAPDSPKMANETKTLVLGEHRFLMSGAVHLDPTSAALGAAPGSQQGVQKYSVDGDMLTLFYLDDSVLQDAIAQGKVAGRLPPPDLDFFANPERVAELTPALLRLDDQTAAFLERAAEQSACWRRVERFRRVPDIEREMALVQKYRATKRTPAHSQVTVALPDLAYFAEGRADVLLRQLEASPEWMVTTEGTDLVAYQRELLDGKWMANPYGGFWQQPGGNGRLVTRFMFRFAGRPVGSFADPFSRPFLSITGPDIGKLRLKLNGSNGYVRSYLAAGQKGLWFECYEQTRQEDRVRTREALKRTAAFLRKARQSEAVIRRLGYAPALMPPGSYRGGMPHLDISPTEPAGSYDVVAWANPGREGSIRLRVFDAETGKEQIPAGLLSSIFIAPGEFMGWSDDPETLFRYDSMIAFHGEGAGRRLRARVELWFQPRDGSSEMKLTETTFTGEAPPKPPPYRPPS